MTDSAALAAMVADACADKRPLCLAGGGSKSGLLGRDCSADALPLASNRGIVDYEPGELVITARAGTSIDELTSTLAAERQYLPCTTPGFAGQATLGGSLACNLSGYTRPWGGSLRDLVLGTELINGKGEVLHFGGRVMKNVAGYDVSRLQAGALGTLGVITEVSLKVLPLPETETTLCYQVSAPDALDMMLQRGREPYPLAGACWFDGRLHLRLAGSAAAVDSARAEWGGDILDTGPWADLNAFKLAFFDQQAPLLRLSLPPTSRLGLDQEQLLLDWGGAQRWVYAGEGVGEGVGEGTEKDASAWQRLAADEAGHAWLYRGGDRSTETAPPLPPLLKALHQRLKQAMDPAGILNPGRLYSWL